MDKSLLFEQVIFEKSPGQFGKARCEAGWNWCPPPLSDFDLWYALSGRGEMRINEAAYPIQKGSCFLVRPGDRPEAHQHPEDRLRVIFIHFQCIYNKKGGSIPPCLIPERFTAVVDTYYFEMMLNRILETEEKDPPWKREEFDLIMKQLFIQLYRMQTNKVENESLESKHKQMVFRVVSYIKEAPGKRITQRQLAQKVDLSPEYLSRIFKKQMGTSLKQYMTDVRLERAAHLLQETSMNVSQVAAALGYTNVFLLSKQFKQRHGHPPSYFKYKGVHPQPHS